MKRAVLPLTIVLILLLTFCGLNRWNMISIAREALNTQLELRIYNADDLSSGPPGFLVSNYESLKNVDLLKSDQFFIDLIKREVSPKSWQKEDVMFVEKGGKFIVMQTPQVQKQIARFLDDYRHRTNNAWKVYKKPVRGESSISIPLFSTATNAPHSQ